MRERRYRIAGMQQIDVKPIELARLEKSLPDVDLSELKRRTPEARRALQGRTVWNINSTAHGGGVAEMLWPLVGYARGLGLDMRWVVIDGDKGPGFSCQATGMMTLQLPLMLESIAAQIRASFEEGRI